MNTLICFCSGLADTSSYLPTDQPPRDTTRVVAVSEIMPNIRAANAAIYYLEAEIKKHKEIINSQQIANQYTMMAMGECQMQKSLLVHTISLKDVQINNQAGIITQKNKVIYILGTFVAASISYTVYQTIIK